MRVPADALGFGDECAAVARVAAGGRRDRPDAAHMQDIAQRTKTSQRIERRLDGVGRQQARSTAPAGRGRPAPFSLKIGVGARVSPS